MLLLLLYHFGLHLSLSVSHSFLCHPCHPCNPRHESFSSRLIFMHYITDILSGSLRSNPFCPLHLLHSLVALLASLIHVLSNKSLMFSTPFFRQDLCFRYEDSTTTIDRISARLQPIPSRKACNSLCINTFLFYYCTSLTRIICPVEMSRLDETGSSHLNKEINEKRKKVSKK